MGFFFVSFFLISTPAPTVVHFFYTPGCGHCMDLLLGEIPDLKARHRIEFRSYDIDILENLRLLEEMEKNVPSKGDDLPVVFVGDSVFYGPAAVRQKLGPTLNLLAAVRDTPPADTLPGTGDINLHYFRQSECPACSRTEVLLKAIKADYPRIVVRSYDIGDDSSKLLYEALAEQRRVPARLRLVVPAIFIGDDQLIKNITTGNLEALVRKYRRGSPRIDTLDLSTVHENIVGRFARFSLIAILLAGLLDGVNPCAFATLVFFVSYLVFIGRRRRDILSMAIAFVAAVFSSYFAIGAGAYHLLKALSCFPLIARVITVGFGIAALILGMLSLYDFFVAKKGAPARMILQLPPTVKKRIHEKIKKGTRRRSIIYGSFLAGALVSFLEFGCTGQVYLPTISFMISRAGHQATPYAALFAYNIAFVMPLIAIALVAVFLTTEGVGQFLARRIPIIKLLTALLFFLLGFLLLR